MKSISLGWLRWLLVVFFVASLVPACDVARAQDAVELVDLQTDSNGDGLPDELVAEVYSIRTLVEGVRSASAEEQASTLQQAMANLVTRLPYSAQTRSAQARLDELQRELMITEDPAQRVSLLSEVDALSAQLMQDPAFATTIHTLDVLINEQAIDAPHFRFSIFLPTIAGVTSLGSVAGSDGDAEKSQLENMSLSAVDAAPNWGSLQRGQTLLIRGGAWSSVTNRILYCNTFCHAGTYDGNSFVVESNPSGRDVNNQPKDGVRRIALANWQSRGSRGAYVGLAYTRGTAYAQDRAALDWAKTKWKTDGTTKYNFNITDKNTDSKLYCSQLVWKQQRRNGKDVDSNNWTYLMSMYARWGLVGYVIALNGVMPDEIALDNDIAVFSTGTNP